jgi:hypothetical protein
MNNYARFRSLNASGFEDAAIRWDDLRPTKVSEDFHLRDIRRGFKGRIMLDNVQYKETIHFHDVLVADLHGYVPDMLSVPGNTVIIPKFTNEQNGQRLMSATVKAIQRLTYIAGHPEVEQNLKSDYLNEIHVARKEGFSGDDEGDNIHTATRMMTEAIVTIAQTTALLLAQLDKEYDIKEALESLDQHGVFKLFSLAPPGMIGPLAANGTRLDHEEVLDQELLNEDKFALNDQLRLNLINRHVLVRTMTMGNIAVSLSNGEKIKPFLGCPAKGDDMKFLIGLITAEL